MSSLSEMFAMFVLFVGNFLILHLRPAKQLASCDLSDGVNSYNIRLEDLGLKWQYDLNCRLSSAQKQQQKMIIVTGTSMVSYRRRSKKSWNGTEWWNRIMPSTYEGIFTWETPNVNSSLLRKMFLLFRKETNLSDVSLLPNWQGS